MADISLYTGRTVDCPCGRTEGTVRDAKRVPGPRYATTYTLTYGDGSSCEGSAVWVDDPQYVTGGSVVRTCEGRN